MKKVKLILLVLAVPVMTAIVIFALLAGLVGLLFLSDKVENYRTRFVERNPNEFLPKLEQIYNIDFPGAIKDVKVAKTAVRSGPGRGGIDFILKFAGDPNTVESFLESFAEKSESWKYRADDIRGSDLRPIPEWFKKPIGQGFELRGPGGVKVYVDTTCKHNFVVYILGSYYASSEKRASIILQYDE